MSVFKLLVFFLHSTKDNPRLLRGAVVFLCLILALKVAIKDKIPEPPQSNTFIDLKFKDFKFSYKSVLKD